MWSVTKNKRKSSKYQKPDWVKIVRQTTAEMMSSEFFENFKNQISLQNKDYKLVCLGLGSVSNSRSARHQLALIGCLLDSFLNLKLGLVYDPAFEDEDLEIIQKIYPGVCLQAYENWKSEENVLFYLPHIPLWLLDRIISTEKNNLEKNIFISNNLFNVKETQTKNGEFLEHNFKLLRKIAAKTTVSFEMRKGVEKYVGSFYIH
jgi:hypothetical protein